MAAAYSASKAAVIGMTKSIGKDLATTGVLVNCVAPAVIATPMLDQMSQEHIDYMVSKIPMGRLGQPAEVAELIAFLASRADDVLDRRDVRHLRRARGLLAVGPSQVVQLVEASDGRLVAEGAVWAAMVVGPEPAVKGGGAFGA